MEALAAHVPMVVVPYAGGLETEQTLRAQLLAERGLLQAVPEDALTPESLAAAIDDALAAGPGATRIATDGAQESVAILERLVETSR
jgi:predicted glycosyltransferase